MYVLGGSAFAAYVAFITTIYYCNFLVHLAKEHLARSCPWFIGGFFDFQSKCSWRGLSIGILYRDHLVQWEQYENHWVSLFIWRARWVDEYFGWD